MINIMITSNSYINIDSNYRWNIIIYYRNILCTYMDIMDKLDLEILRDH